MNIFADIRAAVRDTLEALVQAGTLPDGLTLTAGGRLAGTVTAVPSNPVTVTVTATNDYGSTTHEYTFDIGKKPSIFFRSLVRSSIDVICSAPPPRPPPPRPAGCDAAAVASAVANAAITMILPIRTCTMHSSR